MEYSDIEIDRSLTFGEFMLMPSNSWAHTAARGIAEGKEENSPLCLYSEAGCGKTHLLNAIANRYLELNPTQRVVLTSVVRLIENYIAGLQNGTMSGFRERYRTADMLLIDGLEALEKPKQFQEEMLNTLDAMLPAKKLVVLSSNRCPTQMDLDERLKTRITSGLTVEVERFTEGGRFEFLRYQFMKLGVAISDQNVDLISKSVRGNGGELIRAVRAVKLAAEGNECEATRTSVRKALESCGIEM